MQFYYTSHSVKHFDKNEKTVYYSSLIFFRQHVCVQPGFYKNNNSMHKRISSKNTRQVDQGKR
jgi:hypothetical protein